MTESSSHQMPYFPLRISLLIGGGLSAIAALMVGYIELSIQQTKFQTQALQLRQYLQYHLNDYTEVTRTVGHFYEASDEVTQKDFERFSRPFLENYPGIMGMTWAKRISIEALNTKKKPLKDNDFSNFNIATKNDQNTVEKLDKFPIIYEELKQNNQQIMGLDLGANLLSRVALEKARDSGKITTSGPIELTNGDRGFAIYYPTYSPGFFPKNLSESRQELRGIIYTLYDIKQIFNNTLNKLEKKELSFYIIDLQAKDNQGILFSFDKKPEINQSLELPLSCRILFECKKILTVADRQWSLVILPDIKLLPIIAKALATFILVLSLTGILIVYFWKIIDNKNKIEQLIKQRNAELVKTKEYLEKLIEESNIQLQEAKQKKTELLGQMSHELRNPLNILLGFLEVFKREQTLTPEQQDNLAIMCRSGEYLRSLFNNILELSKLEIGNISLKATTFNLRDLINWVIEMFRLKATGKNLQIMIYIDPDVPQYIKTDDNKLRQILINLLDNAIKFTDQGSVTIRLASDNQDWNLEDNTNDWQPQQILFFAIEDTGRGIALENQVKIFEPFVREHERDGAGLGLAITEKLVNLMGGNIQVKSQLNKGTLIHFNIGFNLPEESEIPTRQSRYNVIGLAPNQPEYRLLVVDDQRENRQLLIKLLRPIGFQIKEGENGQEAVEICKNWQPNLIFMDTRMPIMDGYEAIEKIKALTQINQPVIITITSESREAQKNKRSATIGDDILRKPFEIQRVLDKLVTHLGVSYRYESQAIEAVEQDQESVVLNRESLEVMSSDWIVQVQGAANAGDGQRLYQLIEEIPEQHYFLIQSMIELVNNFDYRQIRKLSQPNIND
ncbi:CHASE domain-containing protein [Aphanothece sacrum]|uniref:Circadian input-output histidine kinase CikA n=1 Tax=Aphanothece sacrum FPU1 TaxID=1920663 RepID=A0A401ILN0_APHSA|nr:CHASE domain-containing protein [Aphanothece sacrum]GBF82170.1 two-component sensor histidine kinase [Aphanothece sacrum FPU1]GBF85882.1 two-component sensor histidine kinase [Aphanothece sacrum FPU3]